MKNGSTMMPVGGKYLQILTRRGWCPRTGERVAVNMGIKAFNDYTGLACAKVKSTKSNHLAILPQCHRVKIDKHLDISVPIN